MMVEYDAFYVCLDISNVGPHLAVLPQLLLP